MFTTTVSDDWYPTCVVFDCDGILIDSETRWNAYQKQIFAEYGATMTDELEEELTGSTAQAVAQVLAELTVPEDDTFENHYQRVLDEINAREASVAGEGAELIPGALEVMQKISEVLPVAVASNSSSKLLTHKLNHYGYAPYLRTWVGANDVENPKPAPDMYTEAVQRLGGTPERTLTFEDSGTGVKAAQSAGTVTMVFTQTPEKAPRGNGYFTSFEDPQLHAQLDTWLTMYKENQA